jgi:septal ring-binding cell division protein DamX
VVEGTKNAAITPEGMGIEVVNIEGADIEGADIEGADIEGADIEGADIEGNTEDSKTADKGTEGIRNEGSLDSGKAALAVTGSESNEKPSLRKASGTQVSDRVVAAVNAAQDFPGRPEQVSGQGVRQKNWLSEAQDSDYTLQLMGSHNEDRVQEFIQAQGAGNFAYFETKLRNQSWYVLTVGQYQNREEALLAIRRLPPDLQAQKPWARNVASIRAALQ